MAKPAKNVDNAALVWRETPTLTASLQSPVVFSEGLWSNSPQLRRRPIAVASDANLHVSVVEKRDQLHEFAPSPSKFLTHPLALLALLPKDVALFAAGAAAKSVTAPLDRIKLIMQTHGVRVVHEGTRKAIGFIEAITTIGQSEGVKGYWKGNLPQVIRVIPYSAVQFFAYEMHKKLLREKDGELSVVGRLAAGACAGMTSTFITYPLDVLRLRLAVEPGYRTMSEDGLAFSPHLTEAQWQHFGETSM